MRTTIFKYRVSDIQGAINNYFDRSSELVYVDKFITERHLINGFPIFREEWAQEDDVNNIKTGFFDLKLSMIMSERSTVYNKTILEFLENLDTEIRKYKFIVVCETGNAQRSYSGIIDINNLKTDESVNNNQFYIYCSVTGIEMEFIEVLRTSVITKTLGDEAIDPTYLSRLLYWCDPAKLLIVSQLDLNTKLGFALTISKPLLDNLWNSNLDPSGTFCTITNWEAFRNFLVGYAFKFKVIFNRPTPTGPSFKVVLFYRSDGLNQTDVPKILSPGRALLFSGAECIAIFYTHRADGSNPDLEHFSGVIMTRTNIYVSNDIIYNNGERFYSVNDIRFYEDKLPVKRIDLALFHTTLLAGEVAICKLVPGHSIDALLYYIANLELTYYLKALKKKRNYKLKVEQDSNFSLGSRALIDDTAYICDRINSFDNFNETMEAEFVEI